MSSRRWQKKFRSGATVCHFCSGVATTVDHIVPKSIGGSNLRKNAVPACQPCNNAKGSTIGYCLCPRCVFAIRLFMDDFELVVYKGMILPTRRIERF